MDTIKNYRPSDKNHSAITTTSSWLKGLNIPHSVSKTPGSDLTIKRPDGTSLEVAFLAKDSPEPAEEAFLVNASSITGKRATAIRTFHSITELAGYGKPEVPYRGIDPGRISVEDEFDWVAMRHREFRKCPNPTAQDWEDYMSVIQVATKRFAGSNYQLLTQHGLQEDDLMSYAMIWATNYLGLHKDHRKDLVENRKLMHNHLRQRFAEYRNLLYKQGRNCFPDKEAASIALTGEITDGNSQAGRGTDLIENDIMNFDPISAQKVWEEKHITVPENLRDLCDEIIAGLKKTDVASMEALAAATPGQVLEAVNEARFEQRRARAQSLLSESLAKLPHDEMVEKLSDVLGPGWPDVPNPHFCADAQAEAAKLLNRHKRACDVCPSSSIVVTQPGHYIPEPQKRPETRPLSAELDDGKRPNGWMSKEQLEASSLMKARGSAALPEQLHCKKCNETKPKAEFGSVRFNPPPSKKLLAIGMPLDIFEESFQKYVMRQSSCTKCRGAEKYRNRVSTTDL